LYVQRHRVAAGEIQLLFMMGRALCNVIFVLVLSV
jgi:hypothetical protein